jgi:hypothetical protein
MNQLNDSLWFDNIVSELLNVATNLKVENFGISRLVEKAGLGDEWWFFLLSKQRSIEEKFLLRKELKVVLHLAVNGPQNVLVIIEKCLVLIKR